MPLIAPVFENSIAEQHIHQFIDCGPRRPDLGRDLIGAHRFATLSEEIKNFKGAVESTHTATDCALIDFGHQQPSRVDSR
jgi:hypothetical protein